MGYYGRGDGNTYGRGDYYRGDYYRGDPGFFSSLSKIAGKVVGVVSRVIPGPVGLIAGAASRALGGGGGSGVRLPLPPGNLRAMQQPVPGIRGFAQRVVPGGETGFQKRRSMNPSNSRAAMRAARRLTATRKLLQRIERAMPTRTIKQACKPRGCK